MMRDVICHYFVETNFIDVRILYEIISIWKSIFFISNYQHIIIEYIFSVMLTLFNLIATLCTLEDKIYYEYNFISPRFISL